MHRVLASGLGVPIVLLEAPQNASTALDSGKHCALDYSSRTYTMFFSLALE